MGEAALIAVYTINRCPSPIVHNQTPYDLLFGSCSSYDLLRVFGCVCFVLLQDHERKKLQSCSHLCCFLGYGIGQKGYRCYDPIRKRLRVSWHVVFWEHKMFYQLPHVHVSPISSIDPLPDLFLEESPTSILEHPPLVSEFMMSHKLIEFLVHFSDCSYNVIACSYEEIWATYQIYILHKYKAEMKILAKMKSPGEVATENQGHDYKSYYAG